MIPVDTPWHFTTWLDLSDHWQTGIAGVLAFVAGFGTVVATMIIARRQIRASREEASRVIAATREQTGAFAELRAACVRQGGPLTGEFLDLEREIGSFASQWEETGPFTVGHPSRIRVGKHAGLGDQLALIEASATKLREWTRSSSVPCWTPPEDA